MEKTSLALRLVRISLEIGSQIDSKCHKKWLAKATRIGLENHENLIPKKRESLRIGTKKCPAFNVSHAQQGYNYNSNLSNI